MGSPSSTLATLRPDLGGSLMEFDLMADREGFIGHRVLPVFEVAKQAGVFGRIKLESLLANRETARAPGGGYNRQKYQFEDDSYICLEHGAEDPIDDRESKMYAEYFDAEVVAADRVQDVVLRAHERRIAAKIFNTGTFSPTTVTNEWDDAENATPITDVNTARDTIWEATGLWPNALIINRRVFNNLKLVEQITDKVSTQRDTHQSDIGIEDMRSAFALEHILVGGSAKNTADEGQTRVIAPIWSDEYAMVARIVTTGDIREPGLGRVFHWGEDGSSIGTTMETYRDETIRGDVVRARMDTAEKLLYVATGELLDNITS